MNPKDPTQYTVTVPDLGGVDSVTVVDVLVHIGDVVHQEDSLLTLEGDKATMDVPTPMAGEVLEICVHIGDQVAQGSPIVVLKIHRTADASTPDGERTPHHPIHTVSSQLASTTTTLSSPVYAGPGARRMARLAHIDLSTVSGTGLHGRVTCDDIQQIMESRTPPLPVEHAIESRTPQIAAAHPMDLTEIKPLSKIKKASGAHLHQNWISIPHVTQCTEADITELEAFRVRHKSEVSHNGVKLTLIVFIMKAIVSALKRFPDFNASLNTDGTALILKKYFHIGVAVDTEDGLVVPVVRDVDQKNLIQLAVELSELSAQARAKKLSLQQLQEGCFTISSLGGIGGSFFTPIIHAPQVAILGVSRAVVRPLYSAERLEPRLLLPLSLSYDHRVIDGAAGARFLVFLESCLSDIATLLL